MPRNYVRKTDRQSWCVKNMAEGIKAVLEGKMGYKKASYTYNIPRSTLEYKVKKARKSTLTPTEAAQKRLGRYASVFPAAEENKLVKHVLRLERRLFSVTLTDLREFAFELAESNNISHNFSKENKRAGKDWLYSFLQRHKLPLRNQKKTTQSNETVSYHADVDKFYNVLQSLYKKYEFSNDNIYSVDDIGIMATSEMSKIVNFKIKKHLCSNIQRVIVTSVICMSASGTFMPTMFVLPYGKSDGILVNGAPPGTFAVHHESGRIKKNAFILWFKKFIRFSAPTSDKPVLLLLNGLSSYTKSFEFLNLADKNNVIVLSFPPYYTHKLQPIEVSVTPTLSKNYKTIVRKWGSARPVQSAYFIQEMVKSYRAAFSKIDTGEVATEGFEKTGIYPLSRNVFGEIPDTVLANDSELYDSDEDQLPSSPQSKQKLKRKTGEIDYSQTDESSDEEFQDISSIRNKSRLVTAKKRKLDNKDGHLRDVFSFSENEDVGEQCLINNELLIYWIQCAQCQQWTHKTYSQVEKDDELICDTCMENS